MATAKAKLSQKQRALLGLLRQKAGASISEADILKVTGWKASAWRVYRNNGLYAPYLREHSGKNYLVTFRPDTSDDEFWRQVTQSKRIERFDRPLARALLQRSADNFSLALEVYNRPTLTNRLDAFALLFTTAWEQLLKAELVEAHGEEVIFKPIKPGHRRESISLQVCLERLFSDTADPIRRNIETIAELRHEAAHLVMKELQPVYSHLFQAGVFNYARRYRDRAGTTVVPRHNVGLLALAAEPEQLDAAPLAKLYGDAVAGDIIAQAQTVEGMVRDINDEGFAIPLEWTLRFAKDGETPDVTLVKATEAPLSAVVFGKHTDPEKTYPLRPTQLEALVRDRLGPNAKFNSHDRDAVLFKEGWKNADNEYHRLQRNPDTHKYSLKAVDVIVQKILADPAYLERARQSYAARSVPAKTKRTKQ